MLKFISNFFQPKPDYPEPITIYASTPQRKSSTLYRKALTDGTAFFASLDRGSLITTNSTQSSTSSGLPASFVPLVSDHVRRDILMMSRAISVILVVVYVAPTLEAGHGS